MELIFKMNVDSYIILAFGPQCLAFGFSEYPFSFGS